MNDVWRLWYATMRMCTFALLHACVLLLVLQLLVDCLPPAPCPWPCPPAGATSAPRGCLWTPSGTESCHAFGQGQWVKTQWILGGAMSSYGNDRIKPNMYAFIYIHIHKHT